jgi:pimeloyl-ACP methyl ester carboxylesterase
MTSMPDHLFTTSEGESRLAYDTVDGEPDAPRLVYCHGLFSGRSGFRANVIRGWCETKGWGFLGFDFRGRGDSSGSQRDITLTKHLEDIHAILDVWPGEPRPVLFGSSLGGLTAAWYAARHPDRVAACVLVAPAFSIVADLLARAGREGARAWKRDGKLELTTDRGEKLVLDHHIVADAGDYPEAYLPTIYATPTLIAHGMDDATIPWERSLAFARAAPPGLVDLHFFGDGDHQIHAQMGEVMALTETFVQRRLGGA